MLNTTKLQKDAWFIVENGKEILSTYAIEIADAYIQDGVLKENSYKRDVLIICLTCIGLSLVASFLLIPVSFFLDNEEA